MEKILQTLSLICSTIVIIDFDQDVKLSEENAAALEFFELEKYEGKGATSDKKDIKLREYLSGPIFPNMNIDKTVEMVRGFFKSSELAKPVDLNDTFAFAQNESGAVIQGVEQALANFSQAVLEEA